MNEPPPPSGQAIRPLPEKPPWFPPLPTGRRARYVMIGGFLGAGKTTALVRLARHLSERGLRVGLITNDQGSHLADTALVRSHGFIAEEIAGGCFCCRFDSLVAAARRLTAATHPDVFLAEPVGSCTDLAATVSYPLRRLYGDAFSLAPLSVLLDPVRARRVLGLDRGPRFSSKVLYLYQKQLEEADLLVINKCDLLATPELDGLASELARRFPQAEVLRVSARRGDGLNDWLARLEAAEQVARPPILLDYELYGAAEAQLAWLNATVQLAATEPFDANRVLHHLTAGLQQRLEGVAAAVAHLKMTFSPAAGLGGVAAVSVVRNDQVPELSEVLEEPALAGELIVNLRAEADPALLRTALTSELAEIGGAFPGISATLEHVEAFRPAPPRPVHRFVTHG